MIEMFTQAGEHHLAFRFRSSDDVASCFKQNGYDLSAVVEQCRDPREAVPMFENLLGSTWTVGAGHVIITDVHLDGTAKQRRVEESEDFTLFRYARLFEAAAVARQRAIAETSSDEIETAFIKGVASIEAFLNAQAAKWNARQGTPELMDSPKKRLSIEKKIEQCRASPAAASSTKHRTSGSRSRRCAIRETRKASTRRPRRASSPSTRSHRKPISSASRSPVRSPNSTSRSLCRSRQRSSERCTRPMSRLRTCEVPNTPGAVADRCSFFFSC